MSDQPNKITSPQSRGAAFRLHAGDAEEAAKAGAVAEVLIQVVKPAAEDAVRHHADALFDKIAHLPPGAGFAAGALLRLAVGIVEYRGSSLLAARLFLLWAKKRLVALWAAIQEHKRVR